MKDPSQLALILKKNKKLYRGIHILYIAMQALKVYLSDVRSAIKLASETLSGELEDT